MSASDYGISFPYGATSAPYSSTHPHRGDDRPCPSGTPVVISGVTIGLTGATGLVTGPHLHIQEWLSSYADTRKPQNAFVGGTVVDTGSASEFGNYITIQTADGWHDTYCHLSQIDATKGQLIGEAMTKDEAYKVVTHYFNLGTGSSPAPANGEYWAQRLVDIGGPAIDELGIEMEKELAAKQTAQFTPYTGSQLFVNKKG